MNQLYLPRYYHLYETDHEYTCLFDAITLEIVYIKKSEIRWSGQCTFVSDLIIEYLHNKSMIHDESFENKRIKESIAKVRNSIKDDSIRFLYIVPTVQCNLRCTYCHIQNNKNHDKRVVMSMDTLINGLETFKEYGGFCAQNTEIMFYGGEPFLEQQFLIDSISTIRKYSNSIKITIFTNGTLITEGIAKILKGFDVYVIVSIDGKEESHNAARKYINGRGSFEDAIRGYNALRNAGVSVGISLVAGSHNISSLVNDVGYLAENLKPLDIGVSTLHLFPQTENPNEICIDDVTQKLQEVQTSMREKGMYVEHLFRKIRPFVEKSKRIYDCPSCNSKLLITPWNTIGFCEAFMEENKYFFPMKGFALETCEGRQDWKSRVPLLNDDCYSCPAISICGGGCPYDAFCESGSVCNKDTRRCNQSIKMVEWLCKDLLCILKDRGIVKNQLYYVPSTLDRKLLYGNVNIKDNIPLQNYSLTNEV